ncbi:MAG TPA: tRNA (adenosine(37)-N6)-threonylcarbamoyltransferase complex ATPase subunit type 1 TsaE [Tepidisphaeraceae bacterium]|nr:tRNA (adenosine(37)-N6)-threonylcarbamoyltransferase complex ATPase subunit type 1 TsaE [Tepidisphaeraceae bacterium]
MQFDSQSLSDTAQLAQRVAQTLKPGDCLALEGGLGAGKTTFVRSLVEALGGDSNQVSSPTFMLLNVYETPRFKVFHLDAYRVGGADDFETIGFQELLEQGGVVIVEWASRVIEVMPKNCRMISIETTSENSRQFDIRP